LFSPSISVFNGFKLTGIQYRYQISISSPDLISMMVIRRLKPILNTYQLIGTLKIEIGIETKNEIGKKNSDSRNLINRKNKDQYSKSKSKAEKINTDIRNQIEIGK